MTLTLFPVMVKRSEPVVESNHMHNKTNTPFHSQKHTMTPRGINTQRHVPSPDNVAKDILRYVAKQVHLTTRHAKACSALNGGQLAP
jgi:hypothetical protein